MQRNREGFGLMHRKHVTTPAAWQLWLDGALALSEVEAAGVRVDKEYIDRAVADTTARIKRFDDDLRADPVYKVWRRKYGDKTNTSSPDQLAGVVFGALGYKAPKKTAGGDRDAADESAFKNVPEPFLKHYFGAAKLRKARDTYLVGITREMVRHPDGSWFVHPSFNLNTAASFRSSCVAKGTMIEVVRDVSARPNGVPIEDVRAGDLVYCYDDSLNLTVRRVTWSGKTGHKKVVRLHWRARGKKGHLDVTADHRIRLADGRYVPAGELIGRPDTRRVSSRANSPRCHVLAMGRTGDRVYQTGRVVPLWDHRLVYASVVGSLSDDEIVHHRDENHLNNTPSNLEKMAGQSEHATHHAPRVLTDEVRRMGVKKRVENHAKYGGRFPSGANNGRWIPITRFGLLRLLASHGGSTTAVRDAGVMDFETLKSKMGLFGLDATSIRKRYDASGQYVTRGRMIRASASGVGPAARELRVSYYNARAMFAGRGIACHPGVRGGGVVNNHAVVLVEELPGSVDVYDLSVDGCPNFIANEICVHNCSDPNIQNQPGRNPEIAELVRRCYYPRRGYQLVELDYGQIEVRIPCCYHSDPTLMEYVNDESKDMHRDTAMALFGLSAKQVSKAARHAAKNQMVFPTFYGSYYAQCAPNLWEGTDTTAVEGETVPVLDADGCPKRGEDGKPVTRPKTLREHMAERGVTELGACDPDQPPAPGTFEAHVKAIEDDFWNRRFRVYSQWKRDWFAAYQRDGGFMMLSGFAVNHVLDRKQVCNYPIQGCAFHCCLWSLVRIVRWLKKYKFCTRVIGEIHDCINFDCHPAERDDVIHESKRIMSEDIRRAFPWLNVPLTVEPEACPIDGSWYDKTALVEVNGSWEPKDRKKWEAKFGAWA
jgi:hypothetical protein